MNVNRIVCLVCVPCKSSLIYSRYLGGYDLFLYREGLPSCCINGRMLEGKLICTC